MYRSTPGFPRILYALIDGGGGSAPPAPPVGDGGGSAPPAPPPAPPAPSPDGRPDYIPEKFWDPASKAPRIEDLAKSYRELETFKGSKLDEVKKQIEAEFFKERPESAEKYELPKFDDERINVEALGKHPMVEWFRGKAFARGMSQADFQEAVTEYVKSVSSQVPNDKEEIKKLGDNGPQRIAQVQGWAAKHFTRPEEIEGLRRVTQTAEGFMVLEKAMRLATGAGGANEGEPGGGGQEDTRETIEKLMASPAYYSPANRDPEVVKRVERFFARFNDVK